MQYWLMKSEPDVWSIDQQIKAGSKGAPWDGVRNYQAASRYRQRHRSTDRRSPDAAAPLPPRNPRHQTDPAAPCHRPPARAPARWHLRQYWLGSIRPRSRKW